LEGKFASTDSLLSAFVTETSEQCQKNQQHSTESMQMAVTSACVDTFFDVTLKGGPAAEMDALMVKWPELRMGIDGGH
jgi:hypothetical protein